MLRTSFKVVRHVSGASNSRTPSRCFVAPVFGPEKGTFLEQKALDTPLWCFIARCLALKQRY